MFWKLGVLSVSLLFCFATLGYARDVTLAWDANMELDLVGYKVYYRTGSSGPPYDGTDADQDSSPITVPIEDLDDPDNPEYILTGLDDYEDYFFVVTAYDDEGLESYYSNAVSTDDVAGVGGDLGIYSGSGSTSSDSGGIGGCFISAFMGR